MRFVVRFEVDACYAATPARAYTAVGSKHRVTADPADSLAARMSTLSVSSTAFPSVNGKWTTSLGVTVIEAGQEVQQRSLIELKTRSARTIDNFDWNDAYTQLYLGQTPTSIIGVHRSGMFYEKREKKLDTTELRQVARRTQHSLKQLG